MSKQNFYTLLSRYRSGECSDREKRLVEQWFSQLDDFSADTLETDVEAKKRLEEKIWIAIQTHEQKKHLNRPLVISRYWWWAAAILLSGFLGFVWFSSDRQISGSLAGQMPKVNEKYPSQHQIIRTTNSGMSFTLSDGTVVRLDPFSTLEYPSEFIGPRREVTLKGRALFQVFRNPDQPFIVHSGEIVTKVLGTSFWVDGRDPSKSIEVAVVSGKVSVFKAIEKRSNHGSKPDDDVILTANQRVTFSRRNHIFETGLVDNPVMVIPETTVVPEAETFIFGSTPVTEVVRKLSKSYGIEIVLEGDAVKDCLFRGDISQQPLFTKLDLLCSAINATYEIRGTKVFLNGNGCAFARQAF